MNSSSPQVSEAVVAAALIAEIEAQTDGSWPNDMTADGRCGLVDAHLCFYALARAAIACMEAARTPSGPDMDEVREVAERLREVVDDAGIRITDGQEKTILEAADLLDRIGGGGR